MGFKSLQEEISTVFVYLFLVSSIYIFFFLYQGEHIYSPHPLAYYNNLIDSFLEFKLNLSPRITEDLSLYQGKWYLYWGPSPILFILPFYVIFNSHPSDHIYNLVCGILNILIFYLVLKELVNYFKLKLSSLPRLIIILSFALASPNFGVALRGGIYFTSQIVAVLYLLLFFLTFFKFLKTEKFIWLILSVIFCNLAWLARYTMIFHLILFLYPLLLYLKKPDLHAVKKTIFITLLISLFSLFVFTYYNYLRFGNFLETGYRFVNGSYGFILQSGQFFSPEYILKNLNYYFLNDWGFSNNFPFLNIHHTSIFLSYPLTLLGFISLIYCSKKSQNLFLQFLAVVTLLTMTSLVLYINVGIVHDNRYIFDLIPTLFLASVFTLRYIPQSILSIGLILSTILNVIVLFFAP